MDNRAIRKGVTTRVIRPGDKTDDDDKVDSTMEQRIEAVWQLTLLCYAWNKEDTVEPRLRRTVSRVQRKGR